MDDQTKGVDIEKTIESTDNIKDNVVDGAKSGQKPKKAKSEKKKPSKLQEVIAEYKRVIWTPKKDLFKQTGTVITVSIMVGIIIYIIDIAFGTSYNAIFKLITG